MPFPPFFIPVTSPASPMWTIEQTQRELDTIAT